jgi:ribosomal protein S27E
MATKIPEAQAKLLFIQNKLEPLLPFPGTQKPWKSKCLVTGKIVSPTYGKVRDFGHRCSYCSGFKVDEVEAVTLMMKAGFKTLVPYPGGNKPWKSQCLKCKKIFSPQYTSVKMGFGCKYCAHRAVEPSDAIKAMKERRFKTLEPFPGATKPWNVQCLDCKRKFQTIFHSLNTKTRCRYCTGTVVDEQITKPVLAKLKLTPLEKFPGAKEPWKLRCQRCNRVVTPSWTHLTRKDRNVGGCVFCSRRRVHMDDVMELLKEKKLKPIGQFINGKTPWLCQCLKCKREVFPRINGLKNTKSGCIYCAGLRIDEKNAIKLANKNGFTPLVPYPGAKTGWECLCNICGQISKPNYTSMQQGINRCKFCATGGFDFNLPAIIYLITNSKLGAHKIGVAGAAKHNERLAKHAKQGWTLYKHKEFKKGIDAFNLEGKILHWLRYQKNLPPYLSIEQMPQAGWSETVDASEIDLPTIWAKVEELNKVGR